MPALLVSIAYSDLFTLAGLVRILAPHCAREGSGKDSIIVGISVVRDDSVPAGMVEMRWSDGMRERSTLSMAAPAKETA